jgi:hypothetical protein
MESTGLSSKVKVEVPPPLGLVADLVRIAGFPPIGFLFLDTSRLLLLSSTTSSSFRLRVSTQSGILNINLI